MSSSDTISPDARASAARGAPFDRLQRLNRQLEALYDVTMQLVGQKNLATVLPTIVTKSVQITAAAAGYLFLWDAELDRLVLHAGAGDVNRDPGFAVRRDESFIGQAWRRLQTVTVADYPRSPDKLDADGPLQTAVATPLCHDQQFVGVLGLAWDEQGAPFTGDDVQFLERLAPVAAAVIVDAQADAAHRQELAARERLEIELRRSERRYRALIKGLPDLLFRVDANGVLRDYFNPVGAASLQVPPDMFLGRSLTEVFPETLAESALAAVANAAAAGEVQRIEYQLSAGDHDWAYEARFIATDDDEIVIVIRDITESKQAHAVLARQLRELTALVDTAKAVSSTLDLQEILTRIAGRILDLTDAGGFTVSRWDQAADTLETWLEVRRRDPDMADKSGVTYQLSDFPAAKQVLMQRRPLVIQATDRQQFAAETPSMVAGEKATRLLLPLAIGADVIGLVELDDERARRFRDADIHLCQALVDQAAIAIQNARLFDQAHRELTERRRAEASLRESEARLVQFINALTVGVLVVDQDGGAAYANEHIRDLLALEKSGTVDLNQLWARAYVRGSHEPYPLIDLPLARALKGEASLIDDIEVEVGGSRVPLEIRGTPILDADGRVKYAVSAIQNIEARLRAQQVLVLARDQALAASRVKSELVARVSHELRTPLNAITGYTEMLAEGIFGPVLPEQKEVMAEIIDSASYLAGLVNRLLDQAQLEARRLHFRLEKVTVRRLAQAVMSRMSVIAHGKGLLLLDEVAADVPEVILSDSERLQQILVNLINNAIKFTPAGSVTLRVYRPDFYQIAFAVEDTGIGIPQAALQLIFEPFSQVDGSHTRSHEGAGLGLSIVQQLVNVMEGVIEVSSREGEGSTFTVLLPLLDDGETAAG